MTRKEAGQQLKANLIACSTEQAQDVADILHLGGGLIPLPEGTVCSGPNAIPPERRESYANLIDALYDCDPDSGAEEWEPVRAGAWESVLATIVVEGEWQRIRELADDLRADEQLVQARMLA